MKCEMKMKYEVVRLKPSMRCKKGCKEEGCHSCTICKRGVEYSKETYCVMCKKSVCYECQDTQKARKIVKGGCKLYVYCMCDS